MPFYSSRLNTDLLFAWVFLTISVSSRYSPVTTYLNRWTVSPGSCCYMQLRGRFSPVPEMKWYHSLPLGIFQKSGYTLQTR